MYSYHVMQGRLTSQRKQFMLEQWEKYRSLNTQQQMNNEQIFNTQQISSQIYNPGNNQPPNRSQNNSKNQILNNIQASNPYSQPLLNNKQDNYMPQTNQKQDNYMPQSNCKQDNYMSQSKGQYPGQYGDQFKGQAYPETNISKGNIGGNAPGARAYGPSQQSHPYSQNFSQSQQNLQSISHQSQTQSQSQWLQGGLPSSSNPTSSALSNTGRSNFCRLNDT